MFVFPAFIIPLRIIRMQAFICEYKLKELVLQNGCPSNYLALLCKTTLIKKASIQIPKAFKQHNLKHFYPKKFLHTAGFFPCFTISFTTFLSCNSVNGFPHDFTKSNCGMPWFISKKHFKKENLLRKGGSTQYRGCGFFQNRGLVPPLPTMCDF